MASTSRELENVGLASVMIVLCVLAIVFNVMVILVVSRTRSVKSSTDMFVVNMAISDLLQVGLALPLKLNTSLYTDGGFHGGNLGCKLIQFVPLLAIMCSISTMVAISFDRFFVIASKKSMRLRTTVLVIGFIWLFSFATSAPQLYEYSTQSEFDESVNETHISCGSHDIPENFETIYAIIVLIVAYLLPLVLIAVNYIRLLSFLYDRSQNVAGSSAGQGGYQISRSKIQTIKLLISISIVFALLWLPDFVLFTIEEITDTDNSSASNSTAHNVKHLMIALSTMANPVLYIIFNPSFRRELREVIKCRRSRAVTPTTKQFVVCIQVQSLQNKE